MVTRIKTSEIYIIVKKNTIFMRNDNLIISDENIKDSFKDSIEHDCLTFKEYYDRVKKLSS